VATLANSDTGKRLDFKSILDEMREKSKTDTGKIAEGTIYHFFEGRKQDKDGHWQGNGYFYWQKVYKDPDTGKRIRKGGKAFATCPDEERKRQFLRDTGRVIEPDTGRLQKVQGDTGRVFAESGADNDAV
jgi:hypothetical protein